MTYREHEALYLVIFRDTQAEQKLRDWAKLSSHNLYHIDGNRMRIFDMHTYHRFCATWTAGFDTVTVWDNWNRRPVYR